jgi:hypothetical protein
VCGEPMSPIRFILLVFLVAVPSLALAETKNFGIDKKVYAKLQQGD